MIHLFYIYSGIVARMVPLIIEHLNLKPEDVLVVTDRSQTAASVASGLPTAEASFEPLLKRWRTIPYDWCSVITNSHRIEQLTGGRKFIAYLPSASDPTCQQILWHPLCRCYWLIEEGLGSYCQPGASPVHPEPFTRYQKFQLGLRIRGLGRISPTITDYPHWPSKYNGAFGSNASAFPDFPPQVINLDHPLYQAVDSMITRLVIFDDFANFNPTLQAIYLNVIRQVISSEHTPGDHWAYKLHPRCAAWPALVAEAKRVFDEILPPGTPCDQLAPDTCAEDIGLSPAVTTYGYMSSCLFYIHECGGKVASFKTILESREPTFHKFWLRFFPPVLETLVGDYRMLPLP